MWRFEALTDVLDVEQVRAALADQREQRGQRPRAVGQPRLEDEAPPGLGLVAPRDLGEQAGADVAARQDHDCRAVLAGRELA